MIRVPNFPELTAAKVYEMVKRNPSIRKYLPDYNENKISKQFLFNVRCSSLLL
jgi:hypothetical protein